MPGLLLRYGLATKSGGQKWTQPGAWWRALRPMYGAHARRWPAGPLARWAADGRIKLRVTLGGHRRYEEISLREAAARRDAGSGRVKLLRATVESEPRWSPSHGGDGDGGPGPPPDRGRLRVAGRAPMRRLARYEARTGRRLTPLAPPVLLVYRVPFTAAAASNLRAAPPGAET